MDQLAIGRLAERAAEIAERSDLTQLERASELGRLVDAAAREHHVARWFVTSAIGREWDRLGIKRVALEVGDLGG